MFQQIYKKRMASTHCGNRGTEVVEHGQSFTFRTGEKFCSTCVRQATAVYNYIILWCLSPERLGGLRQKGHRTQNLGGHSLSAHFQCTIFLIMSLLARQLVHLAWGRENEYW